MIPIGDNTKRRRTPWVNYAIIAANIAVFIYMMSLSVQATPERVSVREELSTRQLCYGLNTPSSEIDRFYCRWSFQPREWLDTAQDESQFPEQSRVEVLLTILTSVFLHAGWLHIIGNMLFLWVFGDNIEDRLGHIPYVLFYAAAGVVASLTQAAIDTNELIPNVGASGAVAGVLGAYLVLYPKAMVTTLIPIAIVFIPFPIPAIVMIGLWFAQNLLAGFATLGNVAGPEGGVAFFAHIGGFVFGAALLLLLRPFLRPPKRTWER